MDLVLLKQFAETYSKLEEKALEIMKIHGIGHYDLDAIEIEDYENKTSLNIKTSFYYSGCGTESEWLSFELEEMVNDLSYFQDKHNKKVQEKEIQKQLADEKIKTNFEDKEKAEYKRLKTKYGN